MLIKDILTKEKLEKLVKDYTTSDIADKYNCSQTYVQKLLKKYLIKCPYCSVKLNKKYIGKRYGFLLIQSYLQVNHRHDVLFKCLCDCGNTTIVKKTNLITHHTKSCGCLVTKKRENTHGSKHVRWTGHGEIYGYVFTKIKTGAQKRKIEFNITIEYIWEIYLKQNRKCYLSGCDIGFSRSGEDRINTTASLDRIDSSKGYIEGNVAWTHKKINIMKGSMSIKEFKHWVYMLSTNLKINSNIDFETTKCFYNK